LTHTQRTSCEIIAQICALFARLYLLLELIYDTINMSKTSVNRWNQGVFRPALCGFAAVAASRNNASCDGSGPRGLGFESRHSDQKTGIRFCGFQFFNRGDGIRKAVKKTCRWHVFRPWENPLISGCTPCGCGQKSNMCDFRNPLISLRPLVNPYRVYPFFIIIFEKLHIRVQLFSFSPYL